MKESARYQEETMTRMMRMLEQRTQPEVALPASPPVSSSPAAPSPVPVAPAVPTVPVTSGQMSRPEGELTPEEERYLVDLLMSFHRYPSEDFLLVWLNHANI